MAEQNETKYSEFLANKFKVPTDRVSFSRAEYSGEEQKANEQMENSIKAQVDFSGQKVERIGGIRI